MSERFAPIPYAALAVAGPDGQLAVLDLYTRAHTARWSPLMTTERDLMAVWKVDQRKVSAILATLVRAGFIRVDREKWQPTLITVFDPTIDRPIAAGRAADGAAENISHESTSQDVGAADRAADRAASRAGEDTRALIEPNRTEPKKTIERESAGAILHDPEPAAEPDRTPTGNGQAEEAIAVALLSELRRNPGRPPFKPLTPAEQRAIRDVVREGACPDDVAVVADWVENSAHADAKFLRERRLGWKSIANDRWPARLAFAREWDARGRVDPVATGPPARAAPASFLDSLKSIAAENAVADGYAIPEGVS